jgi:hypothetical protein
MTEAAENTDTLYEHVKRPEWGLAILASEADDRQQFQFEDGQARTFKKGFAHFMKPVDRPLDKTLATMRNLKAMMRDAGMYDTSTTTTTTSETDVSVTEQLSMFKLVYPEAFEDPTYLEEVRGEGVTKPLKRHRAAAIAKAQEELAKDRVESMLAEQDYAGIHAALLKVMASTDMAPTKEAKLLKDVSDDAKKALAEALVDVLYGEGDYGERFDRYLGALREALGRRPSWELATVASALVHPAEHVCIKGSAFRSQARSMAPSLRFDATSATGPLYERLRVMAGRLKEQLEEAGAPPRDLVDVYDFVWATQRPSAKKLLGQVRSDGR